MRNTCQTPRYGRLDERAPVLRLDNRQVKATEFPGKLPTTRSEATLRDAQRYDFNVISSYPAFPGT